jgi:hypothetical protein
MGFLLQIEGPGSIATYRSAFTRRRLGVSAPAKAQVQCAVLQGDHRMPFFKNAVVTESMEIKTSPAELFGYLTGIMDNDGFKTLNADNISFRWIEGEPWVVGSVACAEKYLHGKLHRFTFVISKVVPNRHIEYRPTSGVTRMIFPKKEFIIEQTTDGCRFISSATFRIGWIGKTFFGRRIDDGLAVFRAYLQEEARNLKGILEEPNTGGT